MKEAGLNAERLALRQIMLNVDNRVQGPEHRDTLTSRDNLAGALYDLGDYRQAAELHRQTLDIRRRTLGPEHTDTLTSHSNLAAALAALDRPPGPAA